MKTVNYRTNRHNHRFLLLILLGVVLSLPTLPGAGSYMYGFAYTQTHTPTQTQKNLTDFDVFQAEIGDVFRSLAELGDFNVLLDPKVTGVVTFKLNREMGVKEAVELLAHTYGYSVRWLEETETFVVGDETTFKNLEVMETRVYQLNYARSSEALPGLQVAIPVNQIGVDARTNQLTIKASLLEHQNIATLLARLDRKMPQVNIDARVEEVRRSATRDLGINWGIEDFSIDSSLHFNLTTLQTLQALEEESKARLLANPNVSSIDGKEAKIFIGDKFPVITTQQSEEGIQYQIEYIEVGTILTITPLINEPQVVTVTVKAEVSTIVEWKKTGNGDDIPVIRTREASSVVRLKEGEVFALSGLNLLSEVEAEKGVPFLAKIPLIGWFFSTKKQGPDEDTEVFIFLTPKIVEDEYETAARVGMGRGEKAASLGGKESPGQKKLSAGQDGESSGASVQQETETTGAFALDTPEHTDAPAPPSAPPVITPVTENPTVGGEPNLSTPDRFLYAYQVVEGDSLTLLGKCFGVNPEEIVRVNGLSIAEKPSAGQVIQVAVPGNRLYKLKPQETLWRLAKRYGTTVALLMKINNLSDVTKLRVGQLLILPVPADKIVNSAY